MRRRTVLGRSRVGTLRLSVRHASVDRLGGTSPAVIVALVVVGIVAFSAAILIWSGAVVHRPPARQEPVGDTDVSGRLPAEQGASEGSPGAASPDRELPQARPPDQSAVPPAAEPATRQQSPGPASPPPEPTALPPQGTAPAQAAMSALKQEALQVVTRLTTDFPESVDPIVLMGNVYARHGNSTEAVSCWQRCLQRDPKRADAYKGIGMIALQKGNYEQAAALWRKALKIDPTLAGVHYNLACALMSLGKPEEAVTALQEEVRISPRASQSHFLLGQAYLQLNQYEKAKECYRAAVEIRPDYWNAYYGLAMVCTRLGQREQSKAHQKKFRELKARELKVLIDRNKAYDDFIALRKSTAQTLVDAGRMYHTHGRLQRAEELWRRAAELDEKNVECRAALAAIFREGGKLQESLRMYRQLIDIEPENAAHYMNAGVACVELRRFDSAEEAFRAVCRLAPDAAAGYSVLAKLHLLRNVKLSEARDLASKAAEFDPNAENYALLSQARDKLGDAAGALAAMKRAIELEPGNPRYKRIYAALQNNR